MKFCTSVIAIFALSALAGCASHTHELDRLSAAPLIKGEFAHEPGTRLTLEAPGRRYEATGFAVRTSQDLSELRKRYAGTNPKHWDRITSGLDNEHKTYAAEPVLKAQDGAELSCRLAWQSGGTPAGICVDPAGVEYSIRFE
jgi:hypothetical protein